MTDIQDIHFNITDLGEAGVQRVGVEDRILGGGDGECEFLGFMVVQGAAGEVREGVERNHEYAGKI